MTVYDREGTPSAGDGAVLDARMRVSQKEFDLKTIGHYGPIDFRWPNQEGDNEAVTMPELYRWVIKQSSMDRLTGKWNGESLWRDWDVKRVQEILNENKWDE